MTQQPEAVPATRGALRADLAETEQALRLTWRASRQDPFPGVTALIADTPNTLPAPLALLTDEARALRTRIEQLDAQPSDATTEIHPDEAAALLRTAHTVAFAAEQTRHAADRQTQQILATAAHAHRRLTPAEIRHIDRAARAIPAITELLPTPLTEAHAETLLALIARIRIKAARRELDRGLVLTEQMRRVCHEATLPITHGEPVLLIGETGGAKTALAEHLAQSAAGTAAEFVSGYGDISSAQVIGSHELGAVGGATVTTFAHGPLLRAMRQGTPLILDEINAMPPEFLKRLNRILQLRPGATFAVQEQPGLTVPIAAGFTIIATANEQRGARYRGIERLSAELVNRFGANTYRIHYPDADLAYTEYPRENALLAAAALADRAGRLPRFVTAELIERIARVAFISQQVFTGNRGAGFSRYTSTDDDFDEVPGLEEAVLAPRTLIALLEKIAHSYGLLTVEQALARFVQGVMHADDRRVLTFIIEGQGFAL